VGAARYVLSAHDWRDPDSSARSVIIGDLTGSLAALADRVRDVAHGSDMADGWRTADARVGNALGRAVAAHPRSEVAMMQAVLEAVPANATLQIGNSLPIRVVDHVRGGGAHRTVITQRGAAGIDGLIASAAGATRAGAPVVLVLGDVSFAHDLGGLLAARNASAPLAIVVIDNGGGRIFSGLPVARGSATPLFDQHFLTPPSVDPVAIATALGARALNVRSPEAMSSALTAALAAPGPTVIHAPVSATGAHDVRRDALELFVGAPPSRPSSPAVTAGAPHV
jgi:2-succinyl-5-enolpyruvyl-6-hydroxy-3-cyclohexene-1-carboxylate synthase